MGLIIIARVIVSHSVTFQWRCTLLLCRRIYTLVHIWLIAVAAAAAAAASSAVACACAMSSRPIRVRC